MLKIIKNLSEIIPHFSYKNYKIVILLSVLVLISGTFFLRDLEIEPMLLDTQGLRGKEFKYFIDNFKRFGESTPLVLLQKHPKVDETVKNKFTDALAQELRSMKEILYVQSGFLELSDPERLIQMTRAMVFQDPNQHLTWLSDKFTEQGIKKEIVRTRKKMVILDNPEFREMIAVDVLNLRELLEPWLKESMANFKISPNSVYFDSEDRTSRLIFAQPRGSGEDTQYCMKLTQAINTKIDEIRSSLPGSQNITCEFAGKYSLTAETFSSLNNAREVSEKFGSSFLLSTQITLKTEQLSAGIRYQNYLDQQLIKYVKDKKITGFYSPTLYYVPYDEVRKNLVQVKALFMKIKRRERDSNPRHDFS